MGEEEMMTIKDDSWFGSTVMLQKINGEQWVSLDEFMAFANRNSNKIEVLQKIIDEQRGKLNDQKRSENTNGSCLCETLEIERNDRV